MTLNFKDKAGRQVRPGDYIVYGHALGRCAGLQYAKVLDVVESKPNWADKTKIKLKVIGLTDDWGKLKLLSKASTLEFSERVLIITPDCIPTNGLQMLQAYKDKK